MSRASEIIAARSEEWMKLEQRVAPSLQHRLAPHLYQRMQILATPGLELRHEMEAVLADNPALEEEFDEDTTRLFDHLDGGVGRDLARGAVEREVDDPDGGILDRIAAGSAGLAEHLWQEFRDETSDEKARAIGEWIISNLDADGFLREAVASIAT